jgi:glycosyltransferase involved in cell wall biosynthesis
VPSVAWITSDFSMQVKPPQPNGCAWYRMVLPSRELTKWGWESVVGMPVASQDEIGVAHGDGGYFGFDVTVLKLLMNRPVPALIRSMQAKGVHVVIDVDDFHYGLHEENIAYATTDPHRNPDSNRAYYEAGIRAADTVTVSTAFLADFYSRRVRDVRLVRNGVDTDRFSPVEQGEDPVFGWVGATMWRSGDIEILREWLPGFVKDHGVKVHHAGHIPGDSRHFGVRAGVPRVSTTPMCLITDYPKLLTMQVGLVPLNRIPFSEAKSYLKGLEYAAAGIPFIATPTEEYRNLYSFGIGRLAETPEEWRDHATELLDVNVRREEAERQMRIVREKFDISVKGEEWDTAISG